MKYSHLLLFLAGGGFAIGHFTKTEDSGSPSKDSAASSAKAADAMLREGDPVKLREALQYLAGKDPEAFFKYLGRFQGLDGFEDLVAAAGRKMAEENPKDAVDILNRISNMEYRRIAWTEFVAGQRGLSLLEKIALAHQAAGCGDAVSDKAAIAPALAKDVEGTLKVLSEAKDIKGYFFALEEVSSTDPSLVIGKVRESLESGPLDLSMCRSILETMMSNYDNNLGLLKDIAGIVESRGWKGGVDLDRVFLSSFDRVAPEQKAEVLESIALLPAVRKNFVLSQLDLAEYPEPETRAMILNAMDSAELQRTALEKWKADGASAADFSALSPLLKSAKTREDLAGMLGQ